MIVGDFHDPCVWKEKQENAWHYCSIALHTLYDLVLLIAVIGRHTFSRLALTNLERYTVKLVLICCANSDRFRPPQEREFNNKVERARLLTEPTLRSLHTRACACAPSVILHTTRSGR